MSSESKSKMSEAGCGVDEVVRSSRLPVLFAFGCGLLWLVWASALGFLAIMKFHMPELLADSPWFTYGRLMAMSQSGLVYGFAAQVAVGMLLWLVTQQSNAKLVQPGLIATALIFWNVAVKFGLLAVITGNNTGFQWLEMPGFAYKILFWVYAFIAICIAITFNRRENKELGVSQWFLFASLFWFPWVLLGAGQLVSSEALKGVMQAVVDLWVMNNLLYIWLGLVGLAALFYYIPQFTGKNVDNLSLAKFSFWVFLFFGAFAGVPHGLPIALGIPSISSAALIITAAATIGLIMIFCCNLDGKINHMANDPVFRFFGVGLAAFLLVWIIRPLNALYPVSSVTQLTFFNDAVVRLAVYGFFAMTAFGVIYRIVPKCCDIEWPSSKLMNFQFWTAVLGILFFVLPMAFGGIVQGLTLKNPDVAFIETARSSLIYLRIATLGELLLLVSNVLITFNFLWLLWRCCAACCGGCFGIMKKSESAEVAA